MGPQKPCNKPVTLVLRERRRQGDPWSSWPVSLVKRVGFRFSERLYLHIRWRAGAGEMAQRLRELTAVPKS